MQAERERKGRRGRTIDEEEVRTGILLSPAGKIADDAVDDYQLIVGKWAAEIIRMGIEVKGLWLIDFDSGSGYYCWRYPEPSLQYFHGYDEGFGGRVKLN